MVKAAADNTARVVKQTAHRIRPCDRCGTLEDVHITFAVPLDQGGKASDWNHSTLCNPCRRHRRLQHDDPAAARAELEAAMIARGDRFKEKDKRGQRVAIGDLVFANVAAAAKGTGKSRQTIYNWIYRGAHGARYLKD